MHKIKVLALAAVTGLLYFAPAAPAMAACDPLPTDKGQATAKVTVISDGQYALWMRLWQSKTESDSILLQVDARCPIIVGDAGGEAFNWVNYQNGDKNSAIQLGLNAGEHTFIMAGREAGTGIDKVMLIADGCTPTGTGDNCQEVAQSSNVDPTVQAEVDPVTTPVAYEASVNNATIFVFVACAMAIVGSLGFMVWKYLAFIKRTVVTLAPDQHGLVVGGAMNPASSQWLRLRHFTNHHKLAVAVCLTVMLLATVVGFAVAAQGVPQFETESSVLTGTAKIVDTADASGGKYVLFESKKADSVSGNAATNNSGGSSSGSSGSESGGGSSGGSSGSTGSCPLPKYPDDTCTGVPAGTSLTVVNNGMDINTDNTVIEGKEIHGCVDVNASGVIIRKSKIIGDCFYMVYRHSSSGTNLLIEDSEISCTDHNGTAVGDTGITVRRSNIHGCENGFDVDGFMTIEDNYIHDLTQTGDDPHTDGIQITPAGNNITIKHNRIYAFTNGVNGTSAIIEPDVAITNILIQDNLFAGGAYTVYCKRNGSYDSSWSMINNHFSTINGPNVGAYGPTTDCQDEINISGNVYHESGQPVPL